MSGIRRKLEDLPPHLRAQAEAQLEVEGNAKPKPKKADIPMVKAACRKQPNKTEQRYNIEQLAGKGSYESVTLRLPGGSRYTPDWVTWDAETGRMTCHEVKGSYRHHSQGRAATAFRECVVAFPHIDFVWAQRQNDCWHVSRARALPVTE